MNRGEKTLWFFLIFLLIAIIGVSAFLFFVPEDFTLSFQTQSVGSNDINLYQKITVAYDISDYEKSLNLISDFLVDYPDSEYQPNVMLTAAKILFLKENYEDSGEYIAKVLSHKNIETEQSVEAVILLGKIMKEYQKYDPVVQNYLEDAYLKAGPDLKSEVAAYLGYAYLFKGEYDTAFTYFNRSLGEHSLLGKAEVYLALENYAESIEEFESFLSLYPKSSEYDSAKPKFIETAYQYAESLKESAYYDEAVKYFLKIINKFQEEEYSEAALYQIADIYYKNSQLDTALQFAETALDNDIDVYDDDLIYLQGLIYYDQGLKSEALTHFRKLIKNYQDSDHYEEAEEWEELIQLEFEYQI